MTSPADTLRELTANNREVLYRCRRSPEEASRVVPRLVALLAHGIVHVKQEALRALSTIGPAAAQAYPTVAPLRFAPDRVTRSLAVGALARVLLEQPAVAVPLLVEAAEQDDLVVDCLRCLISLGRDAEPAMALFLRELSHPAAKRRRLAIRGIAVTGTADPEAGHAVDRAREDRAADVRDAAGRAAAKLGQQPPR